MKKYIALVLLSFVFISCSDPHGEQNGYIKIALENFPTSLDPRVGTDQVSQRMHQLLYRGLLKRERNGSLSPDIAEKFWREGKDRFVFELRKGIKFSNGKEITAKDVAYTYNSILQGKIRTIRKGALWMIKEVSASENMVIFKLKKPYSSFPINATLGIVPEGADEDFGKHPVSSGAYFLYKREKEAFFLKPNPFQYGVKNNGIIVKIIPDEVTRALELKNSGIDIVVNGFTPDIIEELKKDKELEIKRGQGGNFAYIGINFADPVLRNRKIRLALGYSINRDEIIKYLMRGYAKPANSVLPPYLWAYEPDVFTLHYSPESARKLIKEAGYSNLTLHFSCAATRLSRELSQILKAQMEKAGINLKTDCSEFSSFYMNIVKGNFQLYFLMWVGISDPDIFRYIFHSESIPPNGANRGRYINPEIDRLIEKAEVTYELRERKRIYSLIQKIIAEELVYIPLWYPDSVAVFRKGLKGIKIYPNGDLTFIKDVTY